MRLICLAILAAAMPALAADDDFKPLFNGKDLTGIKTVLVDMKADPAKTFSVEDGMLVIAPTGVGYFYTDRPYSTYTLRYEWRFPRPADLANEADFKGNTGCLLHIQLPPQVWPKCVEVQGMSRDAGNTFGVGVKFAGKLNKEARDKAIKPVGEWNAIEVSCGTVVDAQGKKRGSIVTRLNGVEVSKGEGDLTEGPIGWQAEGHAVQYRNISIREGK